MITDTFAMHEKEHSEVYKIAHLDGNGTKFDIKRAKMNEEQQKDHEIQFMLL